MCLLRFLLHSHGHQPGESLAAVHVLDIELARSTRCLKGLLTLIILLFIGLLFDDFRLPCIVCFPSDVLISGHTSPLQHYMEQGQVAEE